MASTQTLRPQAVLVQDQQSTNQAIAKVLPPPATNHCCPCKTNAAHPLEPPKQDNSAFARSGLIAMSRLSQGTQPPPGHKTHSPKGDSATQSWIAVPEHREAIRSTTSQQPQLGPAGTRDSCSGGYTRSKGVPNTAIGSPPAARQPW